MKTRKVNCLCGNKVKMVDGRGRCSECEAEYCESETVIQMLAGWDRNKPKGNLDDQHT